MNFVIIVFPNKGHELVGGEYEHDGLYDVHKEEIVSFAQARALEIDEPTFYELIVSDNDGEPGYFWSQLASYQQPEPE